MSNLFLLNNLLSNNNSVDGRLNQLLDGIHAQHILQWSDDAMASAYQIACSMIEQRFYVQEISIFFFLACLNPEEPCYWVGLGDAEQGCHQYEKAINAYEIAAANSIESPLPYFHLSKCFFAIHERENALQAIELAIEY